MKAGTVLVIEDDRSLREGLAMNLRREGYTVLTAADGEQGMRLAFDAKPDLIVLDLMLPVIPGMDILEELRSQGMDVPVLILSARDRSLDKVEGLKLGADDYVTKPFDLAELLARVEARLRKPRQTEKDEPGIEFGEIRIEPGRRRVLRAGLEIPLSAREFDLLCLLARSAGRAFARQEILEKVWGFDYEGTERTVDNYIAMLRKKLEADHARPRYIITVYQVGYKMEDSPLP